MKASLQPTVDQPARVSRLRLSPPPYRSTVLQLESNRADHAWLNLLRKSCWMLAHPLQNAKQEAVLQAYFADQARIGYRAYIAVYPNSSEGGIGGGENRVLKIAQKC